MNRQFPTALALACAVSACGVLRAPAAEDVLPAGGAARPEFAFSAEDERFLNEVERASFLYFWKEVGDPVPLAKDRFKGPVSSIAAVGFQLAALPVGVERRWIERDAGRERAEKILRGLLERRDNKKWGVYLHFPDLNTGGLSHEGYEMTASTVDHALLLAGAVVAGEYFGGPVAELSQRLASETEWTKFSTKPDGFLSMGWRPENADKLDGPGKFVEWNWWNNSDEERLVYVLAVGAPRAENRVEPAIYYKLKRTIKQHGDMPPFVVSWPGCLFTYFFSHCYIDYGALGADNPRQFGSDAPRVDWFENSRRAVLTHRQRCIEESRRFKTLSADIWGLSACAGRDGYIVPDVRPNIADKDEWFEGTVAPYAAGSAIMFTPRESMAALRAMRDLKDDAGRPRVWRDPAEGGYGFADAFNLDQKFVSDDYIGIDQGPLLLGIENARTGLVWKLFAKSPMIRDSMKRLRLSEWQK